MFLLVSLLFLHLDFSEPVYSQKISRTTNGFIGTCTLTSGTGDYGSDIATLNFSVTFESNEILRIQYFDPENPDNPLPEVLSKVSLPTSYDTPVYTIIFDANFGFQVIRKRDGAVLVDTRANSTPDSFQFEEKYVQFSTAIEKSPVIYGLGQRRTRFALPYPKDYIFNDQDNGTPGNGENLYGSHPFHVQRLSNGNFHGLFMANPAPMTVSLNDGYLTYKMMKGPIDLYVFCGSTMKSVISQYTSLIGRPVLEPIWALGVHLCRWGWLNLSYIQEVVDAHNTNEMPLDILWHDIDYMNEMTTFTVNVNESEYGREQFIDFIAKVHDDLHMRQVAILDPGQANVAPDGEDEFPYPTDLLSQHLTLYNTDGTAYSGYAWPGCALFPDFLNPDMEPVWKKWVTDFLSKYKFDGLWLDMNEIDITIDFLPCTAPSTSTTSNSSSSFTSLLTKMKNDDDDDYPFAPGNISLHAVPPSTLTHLGPYIYHHNLYALQQVAYTYRSLLDFRNKTRPFILTRSSFAGSGKYTSIWLGDNDGTWDQLKDSVSGVLTQSLFGFPLCGVDVGGFNGVDDVVTSPILMTRWTQLSVFLYPFLRDHSSPTQRPHYWYEDTGDDAQTHTDIRRTFLHVRHSLMRHLYTLLINAHNTGIPIIRPLIMEFPNDKNCAAIDTQAMVGSELLVCPVVDAEESVTVDAYIPNGRWYDFWKETEVSFNQQRKNKEEEEVSGTYVTLDAPIDTIPVFIHGGHIFTRQMTENMRWEDMKDTPITIIIPLDESGNAEGSLSDDDGATVNDNGQSNYTTALFDFETLSHPLMDHRFSLTYKPFLYSSKLTIAQIKILGLQKAPQEIHTTTGHNVKADYNADTQVLTLTPDGWESETLSKTIYIYWQDSE